MNKVKVPFMDLAVEHRPLLSSVQNAFKRVVQESDFVLGKAVARFERAFAAYHKVPHAVGVASGTDAIHLALRAAGIGAGDEVLLPARTFVATATAVLHAGAQPILVDVEESTYLMDMNQAEKRLSPRTRAIIPVHLYGYPADMSRVMRFANDHNLVVVEDACQAHGARVDGKKAGTFGQTGCFSFYPSKNLGGWGDGGIVITSDPKIDERLRALRNHGQRAQYDHHGLGFNSRLDGLQAAVLEVKLKRLDAWNTKRRAHAALYRKLLAKASFLRLPPDAPNGVQPVYHLFVVRTPRAKELQAHLNQRGVETRIHYPIPLHQVDILAPKNPPDLFPVAQRLSGELLSLPMYPELTPRQINAVAGAILTFKN